MNNKENQNKNRKIEDITYKLSLVSHSLTAISNSVFHRNECNVDNAESIILVQMTVDSIKNELEEIWKESVKVNE